MAQRQCFLFYFILYLLNCLFACFSFAKLRYENNSSRVASKDYRKNFGLWFRRNLFSICTCLVLTRAEPFLMKKKRPLNASSLAG